MWTARRKAWPGPSSPSTSNSTPPRCTKVRTTRRSPLTGVAEELGIEGIATTAEAYGGQVAVVTTDTDTILAVSDDGWAWRAVGGTLASGEFSLMASAPRFVVLIGADANDRANPLESYADAIHIYGVNAAGDEGAIVGIPRDTAMTYDGPTGPRVEGGMAEISHTMLDLGPGVTTETIANETGLPIEGWFVTGFGSAQTGTGGFTDLVDAMGGIDYLSIPYSAPSQCLCPPTPSEPSCGRHPHRRLRRPRVYPRAKMCPDR